MTDSDITNLVFFAVFVVFAIAGVLITAFTRCLAGLLLCYPLAYYFFCIVVFAILPDRWKNRS